MPLVSSTIPNLISGVSQQPPAVRGRTAATEMVNALPSVVSGLQKRPPSEHLAQVYSSAETEMAVHAFESSTGEQFIATITDGDLKVFDTNGVEKTISFPDGKTYLANTSASTGFRFLTIGDTTFVVNRDKTVAASTPSDSRKFGTYGTVRVFQPVASTDYRIKVNNVQKAHIKTKNGSDVNNIVENTDEIASNLAGDLTGVALTNNRYGSIISLTNLGTTDVLTTEDGYGNRGMSSYKDQVQSFSDLAPTDADQRIVRVSGDVDEAGDDYYVVYDAASNSWVETFGKNEGRQLTASTMPHVLKLNLNGTFTFEEHTYQDRAAGDSTSNPDPSFVGRKINDIFLFKGRMVFLADENIIMSETNNYENYFRTTITQLLDSDPIDIASTSNRTSIMSYGVPFDKTLVLFSDKQQFRIQAGDILTPSTVAIAPTTAFNASKAAKAIAVGPNVFFFDDNTAGSFTGVLEYYLDPNTDGDNAAEVTAEVPKYIPQGVFKADSATNANMVVVLTNDTNSRNHVYVYKYFWAGQEKLQSAWGRWEFPDGYTILSADFFDDILYMLVSRSDGVHLIKVDVEEGKVDGTNTYKTLLDSRVHTDDLTVSYDSGNDVTNITMPYTVTGLTITAVTDKDSTSGALPAGIVYSSTVSGSTVSIPGDLSSTKLFLGIPFSFTYTFSPQFVRRTVGSGEVALQDGRLQMRYMNVFYDNSASFKATFKAKGRQQYEKLFTGRNLGSENNVFDSVALETGEFRFSTPGENTEITIKLINDSPFPSAFTSAEWEAMYYPKTQQT